MVRLLLALAILAPVVLGGCATVTRGGTQDLVVESSPAGARVSTSTGLSGTTPVTFTVDRKSRFVVRVEKEGYEAVEVPVRHRAADAGVAATVGNVLLGGAIGVLVDQGTGATLELVPNPVVVTLEPVSTVAPVESRTVTVYEGSIRVDSDSEAGRTIELGGFPSVSACVAAAERRIRESEELAAGTARCDPHRVSREDEAARTEPHTTSDGAAEPPP